MPRPTPLPTTAAFRDVQHWNRFYVALGWPESPNLGPDVASALFALTAMPALWSVAKQHTTFYESSFVAGRTEMNWDTLATQAAARSLSGGELVLLDLAKDLFNSTGPGLRARELARLDTDNWEVALQALRIYAHRL